jgi:minor extracellular serine protease Vpr
MSDIRTGRTRRALAALGTVAMLGAFAPAAAVADDPSDEPPGRTPVEHEGELDRSVLDALVPSGSGLYVVELVDEPVAADIARERAVGRELADARKEERKQQVRSGQQGLERAAEARGARVDASFQVVINGVRIEADPATARELAERDDVAAVHPVELMVPDHADSLPLLGVPGVWDRTDATGEGISVAIIDTGIDYTHAMFGGEGTREAFEAATASGTFGGTDRVVGGVDFVGDDYNAGDPNNDVPVRGENPIDCNGHGTHVGGTTGGNGVLATGSTYDGAYDAATLNEEDFAIAPGVAPEVDLYALKVFGCAGSTAVTIDAIEWAVDNQIDVINMSLGSLFGRADSASVVASDNAAAAGVLVVASAGNSGPVPYITGAPGASTRTISVAANDAAASFPGATLDTGGAEVTAIVANGENVAADTELEVHVLRDGDGSVSLGCENAQYAAVADDLDGKLVVTRRGVCARVDRAIFSARNGAAGALMINDTDALPPFEGEIVDPETQDIVRIPFLGVRNSDGGAIVAAETVVASSAEIDNPGFTGLASFTSSGPRSGDGALKPDVTAPGVSVLSAAVGTGTSGARFSGTSMAAPHVAGVAALAKQVHDGWSHDELRAAVTSTADPDAVGGSRPFTVSAGGAGLVQPLSAVTTSAVAHGDEGTSTISFGVVEVTDRFTATREVEVQNLGEQAATFAVAAAPAAGSGDHTVEVGTDSVTVPAGERAIVELTISASAADVASGSRGLDFTDVSGLVTFTPTVGAEVALRVPYLAVPRARADVEVAREGRFSRGASAATLAVTNPGDVPADVVTYSWGVSAPDRGIEDADLQAAGVRVDGDVVEFAISTHRPWSTASTVEFQIGIDTTGDGNDDRRVYGLDLGLILGGAFNGDVATFVQNVATGALSPQFFAVTPTDNHTAILPVTAAALGLGEANTTFTYRAATTSLLGLGGDVSDGRASFDLARPAVTADPVRVAPGTTGRIEVRTQGVTGRFRPEGVMVVVPQAPVGEQAVLFTTPTVGR